MGSTSLFIRLCYLLRRRSYPKCSLPAPPNRKSLLLKKQLEVLKQGIKVARKYQLDDMKARLREQLSRSGSPVSAFTDPLGVLALATTHGYTEAELAASIASKEYNFTTVGDLVILAEAIPIAIPLVRMIGGQSARTAILFNVLFQFHREPMALSSDICSQFLCPKCAPIYHHHKLRSPPEWLARWSYWAFGELHEWPLSDCPFVFKASFLNFALHLDRLEPVPESLCTCVARINRRPADFEVWANGVHGRLAKRLEEMDRLKAVK